MLDAIDLEIAFRGSIDSSPGGQATGSPGRMTMHGGTIDPNISEIVLEIFR